MTALKVVVACVSFAALGMMIAIPYTHDETAGIACLAATVLGALAALSARIRRAMDRARPSADRFLRSRFGGALAGLLLAFPVALRSILPEPVVWGYYGALWSLASGWLSYKVVQTLLGPPGGPGLRERATEPVPW